MTGTTALNYKGYRFPSVIISHAVWLYFRCSLRFRDVEALLAQRGIVVTSAHGAAMVPQFWAILRGMNGDIVVLAVEIHGIWTRLVLTIRGKKHSLWRAVDQHGNVLDILMQSRRNKKAAKRFFAPRSLKGSSMRCV